MLLVKKLLMLLLKHNVVRWWQLSGRTRERKPALERVPEREESMWWRGRGGFEPRTEDILEFFLDLERLSAVQNQPF